MNKENTASLFIELNKNMKKTFNDVEVLVNEFQKQLICSNNKLIGNEEIKNDIIRSSFNQLEMKIYKLKEMLINEDHDDLFGFLKSINSELTDVYYNVKSTYHTCKLPDSDCPF